MRFLQQRTYLLPLLLVGIGAVTDCSSGGAPPPENGGTGGSADGDNPPTTTPVAPFVPAPVLPRPVTPGGTTPITSTGGMGGSQGATSPESPPIRPLRPNGSAGNGAGGNTPAGSSPPTDYASAGGVTGCCQSDKDLYFYDSSARAVAHLACTTSCGWTAGFYKCGGQGEDPSGQNPRACKGSGNAVTPPTPVPPANGSLSCKADVPTFVGCCVETIYYVCQNAAGLAPTADDCAKKTGQKGQKQKCGWSPATSGTPSGFYGCVDQDASDTDPSCSYPRVCKTPPSACTKTGL